MKKEFETPTIDIINFDGDVKMGPNDEWFDSNVDPGGWI